MDKENYIKEWKEFLDKEGLKYFVFKIEDLFNACDTEEIRRFDDMLTKIENYRLKAHKKPSNNYWVVNRDEEYSEQVKKIIEENEGVRLKDGR